VLLSHSLEFLRGPTSKSSTNQQKHYNTIFLFPSFDLLKTNSATLFTISLVHHVNGITSAKLKDYLAPEEKNILEIQNKVLKAPTLLNMHGRLTM